jgi:hypothetical protein
MNFTSFWTYFNTRNSFSKLFLLFFSELWTAHNILTKSRVKSTNNRDPFATVLYSAGMAG